MIRPRDFIETKERLLFAAINRDTAFLRYYPSQNGDRKRNGILYEKVSSTAMSFKFLQRNYPNFLVEREGISFQHCPEERIFTIHKPDVKLWNLLNADSPHSSKCLFLNEILREIPMKNKGVTGSVLMDLQTPLSDIDFVIYGEKYFKRARRTIGTSPKIQKLDIEEWKEYYKKRFPYSAPISFDDFLWHERRKHNIGKVDGTIFNLLKVGEEMNTAPGTPIGKMKIRCKVTDSKRTFNLPAVYKVDHIRIESILSYTHAFVGQAKKGETVEAFGMLEETRNGRHRLIVGTTREATDEYIKVIKT